jgi:hypothetical protein
MPVARIVLAGANVLAALVFMYLASADWGRRYQWSHGVWRYDVALNGLPLDEKQLDEEGEPVVRQMTEGNLKLILKSGPFVKTQKEEVEKRFNDVRSEIDGTADEKARRQRLFDVLQRLARTTAERDGYADLKTDEMPAALEAACSAARTGKNSEGRDLAPDQWRRALAHVLFALEDKPEEQDRLVTVLGVRAYAGAADRRAAALREMEIAVQRGMESDRASYAALHRQTVQRVLLLATRVADLKATLQEHRALAEKHRNLVNARQADVKQFEEKLEVANAELQKALAEQAELEQQLFQTQRALGQAQEKNQQLEGQIRAEESAK